MDTLCLILAIIGAVNWGLVGFARFDLVAWIFGGQTAGVGSAAARRHKTSCMRITPRKSAATDA